MLQQHHLSQTVVVMGRLKRLIRNLQILIDVTQVDCRMLIQEKSKILRSRVASVRAVHVNVDLGGPPPLCFFLFPFLFFESIDFQIMKYQKSVPYICLTCSKNLLGFCCDNCAWLLVRTNACISFFLSLCDSSSSCRNLDKTLLSYMRLVQTACKQFCPYPDLSK